MTEDFKITSQMTKVTLIERYQALLDSYNEKAKKLEEAEKARSDAEEQLRKAALETAQEATVQGVISNVGQLRGQLGKALNDLLDQMTERAEELERLKRAVDLKKDELSRLHDIEVTADTFSKLMATYSAERETVEREYAARLERLQTEYQQRSVELEGTFAAQQTALESEIAETRAAWAREKEQAQADRSEEKALLKKQREREEADYLYERDRARRIDEHEFQEKRALKEKELADQMAAADHEIAARTAALQERESEFEALRRQVAEFPERVQQEIEKAATAARQETQREATQAAEMAAMERQWETKVYKERISGLEKMLSDRETKLGELKAALDSALRQVQQIAEKVVSASSFRDPGSPQSRPTADQPRKNEGN